MANHTHTWWYNRYNRATLNAVTSLPSVRDAHVADDVVKADVAAGLHALRGEQEGHARLALHDVPPLAQHQTLGAEATLVVEEEPERCGRRVGSGG